MSINPEFMQQFATFDGILAGFALAVAIQLITYNQRDNFVSVSLATFILSALSLVSATFISAVLLAGGSRFQSPSDTSLATAVLSYVRLVGLLSFSGLFLFLIGIGISGWIWSKRLGLVSSISAALAILVLAISLARLLL